MSKSACVGGWFMEKWFSGSASVVARGARQHSGFVRTAIEGSAIAARFAGPKPDGGSTLRPTAVTSKVRRAGSTIETGSSSTASAGAGLA